MEELAVLLNLKGSGFRKGITSPIVLKMDAEGFAALGEAEIVQRRSGAMGGPFQIASTYSTGPNPKPEESVKEYVIEKIEVGAREVGLTADEIHRAICKGVENFEQSERERRASAQKHAAEQKAKQDKAQQEREIAERILGGEVQALRSRAHKTDNALSKLRVQRNMLRAFVKEQHLGEAFVEFVVGCRQEADKEEVRETYDLGLEDEVEDY